VARNRQSTLYRNHAGENECLKSDDLKSWQDWLSPSVVNHSIVSDPTNWRPGLSTFLVTHDLC